MWYDSPLALSRANDGDVERQCGSIFCFFFVFLFVFFVFFLFLGFTVEEFVRTSTVGEGREGRGGRGGGDKGEGGMY